MGCGRRSVQRVLMLLHQQELLVLLLERRSSRRCRGRSFRSSAENREATHSAGSAWLHSLWRAFRRPLQQAARAAGQRERD